MAELRHLLQACVMAAAVMAAAKTADVESRSGSLEEGGASPLALTQRVAALEAAVARLAAVVAGDDHEQLSRRVAALERDVTMVTLLDSRVRTVQAEQRLLSQDVASVGRSVARWGREVEAVRRQAQQVQRRDASPESEKNPACCRALNDSILRAEERGRGVNASLSDLRRQLHNLSHDLQDLQQQTRQQPLLLCPAPYTKVGGQCFYLLAGRWTWDEARASCQERGAAVGGHGDLATPSDVAAFRVYVGALEAASSYVWVGGVREEGKWRWVSDGGSREEEEEDAEAKGQSQEEGSSPLGLPWDLGEPDDTPDQRHLCIHSVGSIKFHDCVNSASLPAVCQVA